MKLGNSWNLKSHYLPNTVNLDWAKGSHRELKLIFSVLITLKISLKASAIRGSGDDLLLTARTEGVDGTQEKHRTSLWEFVLHCRGERMVRQMEGSYWVRCLFYPKTEFLFRRRGREYEIAMGTQLCSGWSGSNNQLQIHRNNQTKDLRAGSLYRDPYWHLVWVTHSLERSETMANRLKLVSNQICLKPAAAPA